MEELFLFNIVFQNMRFQWFLHAPCHSMNVINAEKNDTKLYAKHSSIYRKLTEYIDQTQYGKNKDGDTRLIKYRQDFNI